METMFKRSDIQKHVSDPRQRWRLNRAMSLQEGQWVQEYEDLPSRKKQNDNEWKRREIHIITDRVGLTDHQQERVEFVFNQLPSLNKFVTFGIDEIILGVVQYVTEESRRAVELVDRDVAEQLYEDYDTSEDRVTTLRGRLNKYVE